MEYWWMDRWMNEWMAIDGNINLWYKNNVFVVLLLKNAWAFHHIVANKMYDDSRPQLNSFSINHETVRNETLASSSSSTEYTIDNDNININH